MCVVRSEVEVCLLPARGIACGGSEAVEAALFSVMEGSREREASKSSVYSREPRGESWVS